MTRPTSALPSLRAEGEAIHPQREAMDCFVASLLAMTVLDLRLADERSRHAEP